MDLKELEEKITREVAKVPPIPINRAMTPYIGSQDPLVRKRLEDWRGKRLAEDKALTKGLCPECSAPVEVQASRYGTTTKYYVCLNPDKTLGHCFIRS